MKFANWYYEGCEEDLTLEQYVKYSILPDPYECSGQLEELESKIDNCIGIFLRMVVYAAKHYNLSKKDIYYIIGNTEYKGEE